MSATEAPIVSVARPQAQPSLIKIGNPIVSIKASGDSVAKIADSKPEASSQQNMVQVSSQQEPTPPPPSASGGSQITLKFGASSA